MSVEHKCCASVYRGEGYFGRHGQCGRGHGQIHDAGMDGRKVQLPFTKIELGTGEPIGGEDIVEFRLLYQGEVLASSNQNRRPHEKHVIRQALHPQLRRLWSTKHTLREKAIRLGMGNMTMQDEMMFDDGPSSDKYLAQGFSEIANDFRINDFRFVPLVMESLCLRCSIDILFMRPEEGNFIMQGGDIDGRLKTIFDALKMPRADEVAKEKPQEDEDPFFVLLQDDKLITEVKVTTDQLLLLPGQREHKANDAFMVVNVKLQTTRPVDGGWIYA